MLVLEDTAVEFDSAGIILSDMTTGRSWVGFEGTLAHLKLILICQILVNSGISAKLLRLLLAMQAHSKQRLELSILSNSNPVLSTFTTLQSLIIIPLIPAQIMPKMLIS